MPATETTTVDPKVTADATAAAAAAAAAGKEGAAAGQADATTGADAGKDGKAAAVGADGKAVDAAVGDKAAATADADGDGDFLGEDGKVDDAAKAAHDEAQKAATAWRDDYLKGVETRLSARAKTDDDKKAVAATIARRKSQIARYGSLEAALDAGLEAQDKVRAGLKPADVTKMSDEDRAAHMEANGIPKEAKAYDIPNVAGNKWTEADTPRLDSFKEVAHKKMLSQDVVNSLVEWQVRENQRATEARTAAIASLDAEDKAAAREALRPILGPEYAPRLKLMDRMLKDPEIFRDGSGAKLWNARDEKGHRVVYDPAVIEILSTLAVEHYGDESLVSGEQRAASDSEENELSALMKTDINAYMHKPFKNTGKTGEARHLEIRRARDARAAKGRAA